MKFRLIRALARSRSFYDALKENLIVPPEICVGWENNHEKQYICTVFLCMIKCAKGGNNVDINNFFENYKIEFGGGVPRLRADFL